MSPTTVLMAYWDGAGNVPPQLSLARALTERGHRVRVLGDATLTDDVRPARAGARPGAGAGHAGHLGQGTA